METCIKSEPEACASTSTQPDPLLNQSGDVSLCRLCANIPDRPVEIYGAEGESSELSEKINKYLPIQVTPEDQTSLCCCWTCVSTLLAFHELAVSCLEAEKRLQIVLMSKPKMIPPAEPTSADELMDRNTEEMDDEDGDLGNEEDDSEEEDEEVESKPVVAGTSDDTEFLSLDEMVIYKTEMDFVDEQPDYYYFGEDDCKTSLEVWKTENSIQGVNADLTHAIKAELITVIEEETETIVNSCEETLNSHGTVMGNSNEQVNSDKLDIVNSNKEEDEIVNSDKQDITEMDNCDEQDVTGNGNSSEVEQVTDSSDVTDQGNDFVPSSDKVTSNQGEQEIVNSDKQDVTDVVNSNDEQVTVGLNKENVPEMINSNEKQEIVNSNKENVPEMVKLNEEKQDIVNSNNSHEQDVIEKDDEFSKEMDVSDELHLCLDSEETVLSNDERELNNEVSEVFRQRCPNINAEEETVITGRITRAKSRCLIEMTDSPSVKSVSPRKGEKEAPEMRKTDKIYFVSNKSRSKMLLKINLKTVKAKVTSRVKHANYKFECRLCAALITCEEHILAHLESVHIADGTMTFISIVSFREQVSVDKGYADVPELPILMEGNVDFQYGNECAVLIDGNIGNRERIWNQFQRKLIAQPRSNECILCKGCFRNMTAAKHHFMRQHMANIANGTTIMLAQNENADNFRFTYKDIQTALEFNQEGNLTAVESKNPEKPMSKTCDGLGDKKKGQLLPEIGSSEAGKAAPELVESKNDEISELSHLAKIMQLELERALKIEDDLKKNWDKIEGTVMSTIKCGPYRYYQCKLCSRKIIHQQNLLRHYTSYHLTDSTKLDARIMKCFKRRFSCDICQRETGKYSLFLKHYLAHLKQGGNLMPVSGELKENNDGKQQELNSKSSTLHTQESKLQLDLKPSKETRNLQLDTNSSMEIRNLQVDGKSSKEKKLDTNSSKEKRSLQLDAKRNLRLDANSSKQESNVQLDRNPSKEIRNLQLDTKSSKEKRSLQLDAKRNLQLDANSSKQESNPHLDVNHTRQKRSLRLVTNSGTQKRSLRPDANSSTPERPQSEALNATAARKRRCKSADLFAAAKRRRCTIIKDICSQTIANGLSKKTPENLSFTCDLCGLAFANADALEQHVNTHYALLPNENEP